MKLNYCSLNNKQIIIPVFLIHFRRDRVFESFFDLAGKVNAIGELPVSYFTYVHSKCVITQLTNEMSLMKDVFIHLNAPLTIVTPFTVLV